MYPLKMSVIPRNVKRKGCVFTAAFDKIKNKATFLLERDR